MKMTANIHKATGFPDSLWVRVEGHLIHSITIDRTYDALDWCKRKMMVCIDTIKADTGEKFDIYTNFQKNLICAIPVNEN